MLSLKNAFLIKKDCLLYKLFIYLYLNSFIILLKKSKDFDFLIRFRKFLYLIKIFLAKMYPFDFIVWQTMRDRPSLKNK